MYPRDKVDASDLTEKTEYAQSNKVTTVGLNSQVINTTFASPVGEINTNKSPTLKASNKQSKQYLKSSKN